MGFFCFMVTISLVYNFVMNRRKPSLPQILLGIFLILGLILGFALGKYRQSLVPEETAQDEWKNEMSIDFDKIDRSDGHYSYEDDNYSSLFGIDVSTYQNEIDWQKVKADGVDFVFIRIGRRGATTGLLYEDDLFETNYAGAKENGLKVGVYFFSQAISEKEAREEADWVKKHLSGKQIDFPVVYDCEEVVLEDEISRMSELGKEEITSNAIAFAQRLSRHRYETIIYTNAYWAEEVYDMDRLTELPIWLAQYDVDVPVFEHPFFLWQYSDAGEIDGVKGPVDLNIMFIPKEDGHETEAH